MRRNEKSCVCNVFATPYSKNPVKSSVPSYLNDNLLAGSIKRFTKPRKSLISGVGSYTQMGLYSKMYPIELFVCAVCVNYRLNLFHQSIIVVLIINSAEHRITYNITISIDQYCCRKCHNIGSIFTCI